MKRRRLRDLGVGLGVFPPGQHNAITDVPGVRVGHHTIIRGEGALERGKGPVRTGVTAIIPADDIFDERMIGGAFVLNGAGEVAGLTQLVEWGLLETPILLCNTMSVGKVSDAVVEWITDRHPGIGTIEDVIIPVVGECDDSYLNDAVGRHIETAHVTDAIESATSGPVVTGSVGAGTGMMTCDFKSGIGSASRLIPNEAGHFTLGVLVLSNFGEMPSLRVDGVPIGALLHETYAGNPRRVNNYGSIIVVIGTDAPLTSAQLSRVCKRAALGVGRVGSYAAHGSGEILLGFSTANRVPRKSIALTHQVTALYDHATAPFYEAMIEATEEAILDSLCMSDEMTGQGGNFAPCLPLARTQALLDRYRPKR